GAAGTACATTSFTANGGWTCALGVSCQDVYDLVIPANTTVTIAVSNVTGSSVLRLAVFAPGVPLTGANLLLGMNRDRMCKGQNASDSATFQTTAAGVYRLAVGRDWGSSAGASGTYSLAVSATNAFSADGMTSDDVASGAAGTACAVTSFSTSTNWNCALGVSCQDVFDLQILAPSTVTVTVANVTGSSVLRLAAFQGGDLTAVNLLNGSLADRSCSGQNLGDTVTTPPLSPGLHRF